MNSQMIIKLILRDLSTYRIRIIGASIGALVMGMFMIFINTHLDRMFAGSSSFIIMAIIIPFLPELKNNSVWVHTASLPVSRKAMVVARFVTSTLIAVINLIIWIAVFHLLFKVLNADPQYALGINVIVIVAMHLLFSLALFYFAYYRFNFISAMGFYLLSMIFPQLIQTFLSKTTDFVIEDFDQPLGLSVVAIGLIILAFYSSISYFPKKDL